MNGVGLAGYPSDLYSSVFLVFSAPHDFINEERSSLQECAWTHVHSIYFLSNLLLKTLSELNTVYGAFRAQA
jgi:hypothetical protein